MKLNNIHLTLCLLLPLSEQWPATSMNCDLAATCSRKLLGTPGCNLAGPSSLSRYSPPQILDTGHKFEPMKNQGISSNLAAFSVCFFQKHMKNTATSVSGRHDVNRSPAPRRGVHALRCSQSLRQGPAIPRFEVQSSPPVPRAASRVKGWWKDLGAVKNAFEDFRSGVHHACVHAKHIGTALSTPKMFIFAVC
jgi:hypothetical protein